MGLKLPNIGKTIGDILAGAGRQINPFDNGATWANPHPQQPPVQPQVAAQVGRQFGFGPDSAINQLPTTPLPTHISNPILGTLDALTSASEDGGLVSRNNYKSRALVKQKDGKYALSPDKEAVMEDINRAVEMVSNSAGGTSKFAEPGIKQIAKKVVDVLPAKNGIVQGIKRALSEQDQVIIDELRGVEKQTGQKGLVDKFMHNSNLQRGSDATANVTIQRSPNLQTAFEGLGKKEYSAFSDYGNARTELSTAKKGTKLSKPKEELQGLVNNATPDQQARFTALNTHYKEMAQALRDAGVISQETLDRYAKNNDYLRLQRDMGDLLPDQFGKGNAYSVGESITKQKRKGSKRGTLSVGEVAVDYTQKIHREIARNRTATDLVKTLRNHGLAHQLINADDVLARQNAYKNLAELRPVRDATEKLVRQTSKQVKDLAKTTKQLGQKALDKIVGDEQKIRGIGLKVANNTDRLPGRSKALAKLPTEADMKTVFERYIQGEAGLRGQLEKFTSNKKQLKELTAKLDGLKAQFEQVKKQRKDLWLDAKSHADQVTKNKNTVSILRDGIREVYEVSPQIKEAVNNINPYHMNAVMQILAVPGRLARAGISGLSPVFVGRNLIKDQPGSAINSEHLLATHNPSTFFSGLFNATTDALGMNNNPLYFDFLKHYGDTTSYDLTRNLKGTKAVVNRLRGGKATGAVQALTHPIRSLENLAAITEKSTRFQQFKGEYTRAIKEGASKAEASEQAAMAAWQNSVDFSRAGTWGRVINTVIPYWNPATQGVRQMQRTFSKHPIKSSFTGAAVVGVPLAAATAWNLSNPDSKAIYDNIPEYEKDNNLILIPPGTTQNKDGSYDVWKIPLPPGYKDVFMPIRRAMEAYQHDKPLEGSQIAQDLLQAVTGPVQTQSPSQFAGSFIPQAVKPLVQQYANKDLFTGKQIVPDYMQEATDAQGNPVPESQKAYKTNTDFAKVVGEKLGVSPIRVEKFVKDTSGAVGVNVMNAVSSKSPVEAAAQLAGGAGWKRSFGQAQGIENANKSEGAKYFDEVKTATKSFTGNEQAAFNALHPSSKNFLGDRIYQADSTYNPTARLDIYNRFPKVFAADKALDQKSRDAGHPGNPLFDLTPAQVKKVLEKENLPPGAKDPELSNLRDNDWFVDYSAKRSKFFDSIAKEAKAKGKTLGKSDNPYPESDPGLQKVMDEYSSLPKGTGARKNWIGSHPNEWAAMQNQFAAIDTWQNAQRGKRGLAATEGAVGEAAGFPSYEERVAQSKYDQYQRPASPSAGRFKVALKKRSSKAPSVKVQSTVTKGKGKVAKKGGKPKVSIKKSAV